MNPLFLVAIGLAYWFGTRSNTRISPTPSPTPTPALPPAWQMPKLPSSDVQPLPIPQSTPNVNVPVDESAVFDALPSEVRAQVKTAYQTGANADKLDELAASLETDYPLVAAALHNRARQIRAAGGAQLAGRR